MKALMMVFIIGCGYAHDLRPQQLFAWPPALDSLISRAMSAHPALDAMDHEIRAIESRKDQVTAWDPPLLGIEFFQIPVRQFPNPLGKNMETDYFIQQMIPWPGKTASMSRVILAQSSMKRQDKLRRRQQLIRDIRMNYIELFINDQLSGLNRQRYDVMNRLYELSARQVSSGSSGVLETLMLKNDLSMIQVEFIRLRQEREESLAMISGAVPSFHDSMIAAVFPVPDSLRINADSLILKAITRRPDLKSMEWAIIMNDREISAVRRERYPDFMIKGMYKNMSDTGRDFWSVMIGLTVPAAWWSGSRIEGMMNEKRWQNRQTEKEIENMKNMIRADITRSVRTIRKNLELIRIYRHDLIPGLQSAYDLALRQYQTDPMAGPMAYDTAQKLLKFREEALMAETDYLKNLAELEFKTGSALQPTTDE